MEIQIDLLISDENLRTERLSEFIGTFKGVFADPEIMFLGLNLFQSEKTRQLIGSDAAVAEQVKLLLEPSIDKIDQISDQNARENARIVMLIEKAKAVNSAGIPDLVTAFGIKGDPATATKAVQKLVMRAIQLNLMSATIDKKTNTVYFM